MGCPPDQSILLVGLKKIFAYFVFFDCFFLKKKKGIKP
jgi:hypothetical protein